MLSMILTFRVHSAEPMCLVIGCPDQADCERTQRRMTARERGAEPELRGFYAQHDSLRPARAALGLGQHGAQRPFDPRTAEFTFRAGSGQRSLVVLLP